MIIKDPNTPQTRRYTPREGIWQEISDNLKKVLFNNTL